MRMRGVGAVEQRLDMVLAPERYGLTVTEAAAMWGVSRQTWHEWRHPYDAEGVPGLAGRSSAPHSSPGRGGWGVRARGPRPPGAPPRGGPPPGPPLPARPGRPAATPG